MRTVRRALGVALAVAALSVVVPDQPAPASAAPGPRPFGRTCEEVKGVRFCTGARVASWDGTPLDVDVTLPPTGDGPWPTIVLLHGLGGDKTALEPNAPQQVSVAPRILPLRKHYNNLYYARRGYAVVAATARGFGDSCGGEGTPAAWLQIGACSQGFIRLADSRYEARDTQHLLGLLVDEGIAHPTRIGVTGFSYGGGQAVQLGELRNRIRLPDGTFRRWRSPDGTPMRIGAAYGQWLWTDLLSAVLPNGRFLDFRPRTGDASLQPLGVMSQSYTRALFILAASEGYVVQPQPGDLELPDFPGPSLPINPPLVAGSGEWDLATAIALMELGEPYGDEMRQVAREFRRYHGSVDIPGRPAPLLLESGWNDDLFPITESLRQYTSVRSRYPASFVALLLGDVGHARDANRRRAALAFNDAASAFFDEHLLGRGRGPAKGSVLAYTTRCPALGEDAVPDGGPFRARSWAAIHPGEVTFGGAAAQTVDSTGGDPTIGLNFDPIPSTNPLGTADPCKTVRESSPSGTALYRHRVRRPFVLLGRPTVRATVATTGVGGQLAARLWDVGPNGRQLLVTRGAYRLLDDQTGRVVFQLNGNGYRFARGHTVKLELAPSDAPTFRASTTVFSVDVRRLRVSLPTTQRR
ncbi:CocE/NonD family hydrolase [Nocardioides stalactiti]|uniref:CocE/NonD family hydrolase n=1 Tax=Nocardioides stalactiti TaxID=2755356 RepID=UPI001600313C|nr:CocE/NonD family hydrolase [Nocardioides stalactiti]